MITSRITTNIFIDFDNTEDPDLDDTSGLLTTSRYLHEIESIFVKSGLDEDSENIKSLRKSIEIVNHILSEKPFEI